MGSLRVQSAGPRSFATAVLCALLAVFSLTGCDKASHDNVEKWRKSEKGVGKLTAAVRDGSLDADVRAHAAEALISRSGIDAVHTAVAAMTAADREAFFAKFTPREWSVAKVTQADMAPTSKQIAAKDGLWILREFAEGERRDEIDADLLDWLTAGGFYEQRAGLGEVPGEKIIRAIGMKGGPKMTQMGRDLLGQVDKGAEGIQPIDRHTLEAIAYTGAPEAVSLLLDIAEKPQKQEGLQIQAMTALYNAYVDNTETPRPDPKGLIPNLKRLQAIGFDDSQPGENINCVHELILKAGAPQCLQPLVYLATHKVFNLRLRAVDFAMRCGGADAIVPVAEALPDGDYAQGIIAKYFVKKVPPGSNEAAAAAGRTLLGSKHWTARFIGIELLREYGKKDDAKLVRALASDKSVLHGYWDPPKQGEKEKADPTLGKRAAEVADLLEKKS